MGMKSLPLSMQLALHRLACEADDVFTNRAPTGKDLSMNAAGECVHRMQYVNEALRELRDTGWTPSMLGAQRWKKAS